MPDFNEAEALLSRLMTACAPTLSESERAEVQKFIDVGEYGLALETAVAIHADEGKLAPAEVVTLVERLAQAMCLDPRPLQTMLPGSHGD